MEFRRIKGLPPYVFTIINDLKIAARRAGDDVIDLGFGNPDIPSPEIAVEKLAEAAHNSRNHRYSSSQGHPQAAPGGVEPVPAPLRGRARPRHRGRHHHRRQGGPVATSCGCWSVRATRRSCRRRRTRSTSTRRCSPAPRCQQIRLGPDQDFFANLVEAWETQWPKPARDHPVVPPQPDHRVRRPRVDAADRRLRPRARDRARARLRLLRHVLRRVPAAVDPSGAGGQGGRRRAVHADQVVLDGGLARRVHGRQRRDRAPRSPS